MAQFNKMQTLQTIIQTRVMSVYYDKEVEIIKQVIKACYEGGVRAFESINWGSFAHEVSGELIRCAAKKYPELILGVGPITNPATAASFIQLGANLVIGPLFNLEITKICSRRLTPYTPGRSSVSEIGFAQETGCGLCKISPTESIGGSSFVRSIKAPTPWTLTMAAGAVESTKENLLAWLKVGVTCVGVGSKLFPKEVIAGDDWQLITDSCRNALSVIQKYRQT